MLPRGAMQAVSGTHMSLDQGMDRLQRNSRVSDQVCQGRQAQRNAFTGEAFGLPVQGLVLTIFLEDEHGDQAGTGPSARDRMERGRRQVPRPQPALAAPSRQISAQSPARQWVIRERLGHRMAAREGAHRAGLFSRLAGGQDIFGCRRLKFFKLQFQLIDQPGASF